MKKTASLILALSFSTAVMAADLFATYEVPVGDQTALATSNRFRITELSLEQKENGQTTLRYLLPLELTGEPNIIEFNGQLKADGQTELTYDQNKMQCAEDKISLTCQVQFGGLRLNQPLAADLMTDKFRTTDLQKRLRVLERFSTDPVGIIRIYKRPLLFLNK